MDKRTSIAVLWTVLVLVASLVLWWLTIAKKKIVEKVVEKKNFLLTLNDLLIDPISLTLKLDKVLTVRNLVRNHKVVFLFTWQDEQNEAAVKTCLETAQISIPEHRILFTQTVEGRGSIARELQFDVFVDPDAQLVASLAGKLPLAVTDMRTFFK